MVPGRKGEGLAVTGLKLRQGFDTGEKPLALGGPAQHFAVVVDGAGEYVAGVQEYSAGVNQYVEGVGQLADGSQQLATGSGEAAAGADRLERGLPTSALASTGSPLARAR